MDLLGTQLTLAMKLSLLTVSPDGLRFQASVSASAPLAAGGGRANPGAVTDVARSAQGQGGPEGPLSVAISADAVNRVLHAVWVAGALNLEVDLGAAGGDGGAMPIQFDVAGMGAALGLPLDQAAPGDAPVTLSMRPMLPPVLVPAPAGDPDKAATISLGDMLFSIEARPTGQPAIDLLTVALAIDAELAAGDPDDGQGLAGLSVIADLESSAVPAQAEVVEGGVARLLTLAAPLLTRALGGEAAPAEPGKLTLVDALFGSNGGSLVIAGALGLSDAAGPPPR